jgi:hypothetical protein
MDKQNFDEMHRLETDTYKTLDRNFAGIMSNSQKSLNVTAPNAHFRQHEPSAATDHKALAAASVPALAITDPVPPVDSAVTNAKALFSIQPGTLQPAKAECSGLAPYGKNDSRREK